MEPVCPGPHPGQHSLLLGREAASSREIQAQTHSKRTSTALTRSGRGIGYGAAARPSHPGRSACQTDHRAWLLTWQAGTSRLKAPPAAVARPPRACACRDDAEQHQGQAAPSLRRTPPCGLRTPSPGGAGETRRARARASRSLSRPLRSQILHLHRGDSRQLS